MKEKLQEYALLAEIISAFAVVASLIFVGFEIRQGSRETELNTRAIQSSAYQTMVSELADFSDQQIDNVEFSLLESKMVQGGEISNERERLIYDAHIRKMVLYADMAHYQYRNGLITEGRLYTIIGPLRVHLRNSDYARNYWNTSRGFSTYEDSFKNFIVEMMNSEGVDIRIPSAD